MSPTVLREDGYQVKIYPNDHPPAHVHVVRAGKEARVGLDPIVVYNNWGFNNRELSKIQDIIEENQSLLLAEWDNYHAER